MDRGRAVISSSGGWAVSADSCSGATANVFHIALPDRMAHAVDRSLVRPRPCRFVESFEY